jgi:hypothetical protein
MKEVKFLGDYYWDQEVIGGIIASGFRYKDIYEREGIEIVAEEPLCGCGNYGRRIHFLYKGREYIFNYLTGYPCQCE